MLLTSSKAELTNKVIISVGDEIITNYDLDREIKYLNVITVGQIGELDNQESKKIAIDSLIKDKIKITALSNHNNIIIKDELLNNQIVRSSQNIGFRSIDDFKAYLNYAEYELDEFKKKILLELKWNQLVYQFYKNQIIIDKEKIDKKLKTLIAGQKKNVEYLIYEIFIENSAIKELDEESEEELNENNVVEELPENKVVDEKNSGIIIEAESASYNNKKNSIVEEKSIEKMVEVKTNDQITETKKKDQITIDDVIENIKEEGFENTRKLIEQLPFSYLHVFSYSPRRGTEAHQLKDDVPGNLKKQRNQNLTQLANHKAFKLRENFLRQQEIVLIENQRDKKSGWLKGHTGNYIPVIVEGSDSLKNHLVPVILQGVCEHQVTGCVQ